MRSVATISVANNYIRIFGFADAFESQVLRKYCKMELTKYGQEPIPGTRQKRWVATHVFARTNNDRTEYRMPKTVLEPLLRLAVAQGFNRARIVLEEEPELEGAPAVFSIKEKYKTPREEQNEWIDYKMADGPLKVNEAATGNGKGQPDSAKIKIPGGWTTMGKIKVGDTVTAWDGSPTKVTGVYPQGLKQVYCISFEDGRQTEVDGDHLWEIYDESIPALDKVSWDEDPRRKIVFTKDLLAISKDPSLLKQIYFPLPKSEQGNDVKLPMDPYAFGLTLGDATDDLISIPDIYLNGSHKQRLGFLQGLMDANSVLDGGIHLTTTSLNLAQAVQYLVWSIGGIAKLVKLDGTHRVEIRYTNPQELFRDETKQEASKAYAEVLKGLRLLDVLPVGSEETQCISIAHKDRLYVTDDFIVTHNTYMALYCMMQLQKRTLITIQPRYIPIWQKDLAEMFDISPKDVLVWEYTDLPRLGELCKEGKIDPKIIILPTTRISTYMRTRRKNGNLPCLDEIIANINPGLRIIDEAHESFHEVTLSMFYGNVKKTFLLSATLKGDDPFLNKMYLAMAPKEARLKEAEPENYIDIIAYLYQMDVRKHRVQTLQGGTYNDIALEKSILRNEATKEFYFNLADDMYKRFYLDAKEEGTKCIFFFTLIEMCLYMKERFRAKYPGEDFDTFLGTLDKKTPKKYLEHENLLTTPGSCGTGKDIPGAITCISFHTVFSIQRNKQMIGRLRNLRGKFGGKITPRFVFPVCVDISKHGDCFHKRKLAFAAKQKSWKTLESGLALQ